MTQAAAETAYAKINLALHVRARRPDGYHAIETLFAFCENGDGLTVAPADALSLTVSGPFAKGLSIGADNLVLRAAQALADANGIRAGAHFHLDKQLPVASGIGGGSADAAAALRLLVQHWGLGPDAVRPIDIAADLGADVPACILSQPCRGTHLGDQLEPVDGAALAGVPILLVNPLRACPTGPVFAGWDGVDRGPLTDWRDGRNDLEAPALALLPEIGTVLDALRQQPGARTARMSGSGATCFALFDTPHARDTAAATISSAHPGWWVLATRLRGG